MRKAPRVARIWQHDERTLGITWTSGQERLYDVVWLRRQCPCAHCVDEETGRRRVSEDSVSDEVRPRRIWSVGTYALGIAFDDGHDTGVYRFVKLHDAETSAS